MLTEHKGNEQAGHSGHLAQIIRVTERAQGCRYVKEVYMILWLCVGVTMYDCEHARGKGHGHSHTAVGL